MENEKLDYAFNWLSDEKSAMFELVKQQVQDANPILGALEFEPFDGLTKMPQGFASAQTAMDKLIGATYKPLLCVAKQQAKGTIYWFFALQTLVTANPEQHIVTIAINEFNGNFSPVNGSIVKIF